VIVSGQPVLGHQRRAVRADEQFAPKKLIFNALALCIFAAICATRRFEQANEIYRSCRRALDETKRRSSPFPQKIDWVLLGRKQGNHSEQQEVALNFP
jgi:hypothetical protein